MQMGLGLSLTLPYGGAVAPIQPNAIANLALWLKADVGAFVDAGVTLATNGQTVQQWNDQSGNGRNVTQATALNRATWNTNQVNGLPALNFNLHWYNIPAGLGTGNISVLAVCNVAGNHSYALLGGSGGTPQFDIGQNGAGNSINQIWFHDTASDSSTAVTLGVWTNLCWFLGSGGVGAKFRVAGADAGAITSTITTATLILGALLNGGNNKLVGGLAELMFYNRNLTASEVAGLEAYINSRYGFL